MTKIFSFAFWEKDLTYEGESVYNYLQVSEDEKQVVLSTNVLFGVQSVYRKDQGLTGMYYDYALAAPTMAMYGGEEAKPAESAPARKIPLGCRSLLCSTMRRRCAAQGAA